MIISCSLLGRTIKKSKITLVSDNSNTSRMTETEFMREAQY